MTIRLKQVQNNLDDEEYQKIKKFILDLPEIETNGFRWPKELFNKENDEDFRTGLATIESYQEPNVEQRRNNKVAQTHWWIIADDEIVGYLKTRFELNSYFLAHGGHIGLGLIESARGRGIGTEALRQAIEKCREHELTDVLMTAEKENLASRGMIENCGGTLWDEIETAGRPVAVRYWIKLH